MPKKINGPIKDDKDVIYNHLIGRSKVDILRMELSGYLNAIYLNEPIIQGLILRSRLAASLLAIVITVLLLLSFIPRTGPV